MSPLTFCDNATGEETRAFASLDTAFAIEGEFIAKDPLSRVIRVTVAGKRYYVKRYTRPGKNPLRYWFGRPRVQAEWENLLAFASWGIPTARVVVWGQERRLGRFVRGALITEEICNTRDLADMTRRHDPRIKNPDWVAEVSRQLAHITRTLHAHRFTHNDLKWRNILVSDGPSPRVYLIDCPAGMIWIEPFLSYRKIKDLACLDKVAKHVLSRTQRLRFYLSYRGHTRLNAEDKRTVRRIVGFFHGRE